MTDRVTPKTLTDLDDGGIRLWSTMVTVHDLTHDELSILRQCSRLWNQEVRRGDREGPDGVGTGITWVRASRRPHPDHVTDHVTDHDDDDSSRR